MIPEKTAFVFPGQGSQALRMGRELSAEFAIAREIFAQADNALGFTISRLAWEGPEQDLNDTLNTQPALLAHSVAAYRVLQEIIPGFQPAFVAGHSMGELSALVAAKALPFREALELARTRGRLMKRAGEINPGGMAAILGLDIPSLENICTEASTPTELVQVANDNCPGQVVISGANAALDRALAMAQSVGARRAVRLVVSIAAHSPFMAGVQVEFSQAVNAAPFTDPIVPLVGNVSATPLYSSTAIRADLQDQLTHRVRWTESILWMISQGVTNFIELGSGNVLAGLIKRIDRQVNAISLGNPTDFDKLS